MAPSLAGAEQSHDVDPTILSMIEQSLVSEGNKNKKRADFRPDEKQKASQALQAIKNVIKTAQANADLLHSGAETMVPLVNPETGVNALKEAFSKSIGTFNKEVMDYVDTAPDITRFNAEMRKNLKTNINNRLFPLSTGKGVIGTLEKLRTMTNTLIELRQYQIGGFADSDEGDVFPYEGIAMAAIYMYHYYRDHRNGENAPTTVDSDLAFLEVVETDVLNNHTHDDTNLFDKDTYGRLMEEEQFRFIWPGKNNSDNSDKGIPRKYEQKDYLRAHLILLYHANTEFTKDGVEKLQKFWKAIRSLAQREENTEEDQERWTKAIEIFISFLIACDEPLTSYKEATAIIRTEKYFKNVWLYWPHKNTNVHSSMVLVMHSMSVVYLSSLVIGNITMKETAQMVDLHNKMLQESGESEKIASVADDVASFDLYMYGTVKQLRTPGSDSQMKPGPPYVRSKLGYSLLGLHLLNFHDPILVLRGDRKNLLADAGICVRTEKKHGKDQAKLVEMNIIAKRLEGKDETTDSAEIEIEEIKLGQLYTAEELSRIKKVMNSHAGKKRRYDELGNGSDGN